MLKSQFGYFLPQRIRNSYDVTNPVNFKRYIFLMLYKKYINESKLIYLKNHVNLLFV